MENIAAQLQLKDIDKSTWQKYRFDQIAKNISERVEPTTTDLKIYVGLEHIDSDSIHIKRYGKREDVSGTKLRCYPGDVIFGRRRAYQRKAAVVEFDGFCSAHSLVLRANPAVIHPKLFPFFLHSDTFMHRAVDISVGSLSPTINWGDMKKQEFLLPPLDQQAEFAELLWAGDEAVEKQKLLISSLGVSQKYLLENKIQEYSLDCRMSSFGEVGSWISGGTPSKANSDFWKNGNVLWVTPKDMKNVVLNDSLDKVSSITLSEGKAKLFPKGSTVIVWRSGILQHSLPIAKIEDDFTINQDMKAFLPKGSNIISEYIRIYLSVFSEKIRQTCVKEGTTVQSINTDIFMRYPIPLLSIDEQLQLIDIEYHTSNSLIASITNFNITINLQRCLINQIF